MNEKVKAFWRVATSEWSFLALAVGILALSFVPYNDAVILVGATLAIVALDAILFHDVLRQDDGDPRVAYRLFYEFIWWSVTAKFALLSLWLGGGFFLARFLGVNDWLYYIFRLERYQGYDPAPWLDFTIWHRLGIRSTGKALAWYGPLSFVLLFAAMIAREIWLP